MLSPCAGAQATISSLPVNRHICRFSPSSRGETEQEAFDRRVQESLEVEDRITNIYNEKDFYREVSNAGDKLVLLEVRTLVEEVLTPH